MKIFTAVRHSLNPDYFYGNLWCRNFYPALRQLNCEIIESQVDLLPASRFMQIGNNFTYEEQEVRSQITQGIIDEVRQAHRQSPIHLFLIYFYNSHFDPAGFSEIHQMGILTVNFYCNIIDQFELVSQIAAKVNYAWHAEKLAKESYLKVGANPVWVQMGANPDVYHPIENISRQPKACFVGQRYADRDRYLGYLIEKQISLHIYGQGWGKSAEDQQLKGHKIDEEKTYLGRSISQPGSLSGYVQVIQDNFDRLGILGGLTRTFKQLKYRIESRKYKSLLSKAAQGYAQNIPETFAAHEVVLNFSNVWADGRPGSSLIPHVRLRDFEAPLCRSCYLTGYSDEIGEFYELGQEIDTYQSPEDLADKVRFYLSHPQEADHLRAAGYQRAFRDHTWVNRFQELFTKIGLKP